MDSSDREKQIEDATRRNNSELAQIDAGQDALSQQRDTMRKASKIAIAALGVMLVLAAGAFAINRYSMWQAEQDLAKAEREAIQERYVKVNYAFCMVSGMAHLREEEGIYRNLDHWWELNDYGVYSDAYLFLKLYEQETGIVLTYATAMDYLSEEYEPDGSLRLYDNGLHPEIEAFVEWAWALKLEYDENPKVTFTSTPNRLYILGEYLSDCQLTYNSYRIAHVDEGFISQPMYKWSPQVLDEVAKKVADPDYEMDLLSLQQQDN